MASVILVIGTCGRTRFPSAYKTNCGGSRHPRLSNNPAANFLRRGQASWTLSAGWANHPLGWFGVWEPSMQRLGAIFVVVCMLLIAASAGAVLYLLVGLRAQESMIIAISVFTGLAIYNAAANRLRDRANLSAQIADLSRGTGDLARQVAELGRRASVLEAQGDKIADAAEAKARAGAEAIAT